MANADIAISLMLVHEGGYTKGLQNDSGGETYKGISRNNWPNWAGWQLVDNAKSQSNFPGSLEEDSHLQGLVLDFYHQNFWRFDELEDQLLANCVLDAAVNMGLGTARQMLAHFPTLKEFQLARLLRYASFNKPQFLHSWFERTLDV